jgi:NTE family protein
MATLASDAFIPNLMNGASPRIRASHDSGREIRIGLALGGGFGRAVAHAGVLRVFEREGIPIHSISGVSSGAIAAAAFASGCSSLEIEMAARVMRLSSVASLTAFAMGDFLRSLLKRVQFEEMRIPLAIIASDLTAGAPVIFKEKGDVLMPIHASCAYPGMFPPVRYMDHCLVDGMVSMDVPAAPLRRMGATHVISVVLPSPSETLDPQNMQSVVRRSFQIMMERNGSHWRRSSDVVIAPKVRDSSDTLQQMIEAGERAAEAALPQIFKWVRKIVAA